MQFRPYYYNKRCTLFIPYTLANIQGVNPTPATVSVVRSCFLYFFEQRVYIYMCVYVCLYVYFNNLFSIYVRYRVTLSENRRLTKKRTTLCIL